MGHDRRDDRAAPARGWRSCWRPGALGPEQAAAIVPIVLAIVYSGVLAAAFANVIVFNGVRLLGPTRVITLQSFVPAMAVVLAFFFLGEPIRPAQVVGGFDHRGGRRADALGVDAPAVVATRVTIRTARTWIRTGIEPDRTGPRAMTFVVDPPRCRRAGTPPLSILIDYDGTISLTDVTEILLAEHVAGASGRTPRSTTTPVGWDRAG